METQPEWDILPQFVARAFKVRRSPKCGQPYASSTQTIVVSDM